MTDKRDDVGEPTSVYNRLNEKWAMIEALVGGTAAMRDAGETYLPRESKETEDLYDARLGRSFLFNGYRDSAEKIVAKPFAQLVTLRNADGLPEQLQGIEDNADRCGTSLTQLGRELMLTLIHYGVAHLWIDYPRVDGTPSVADERARDLRPALLPVRPSDLIGWRSERDAGGRDVLVQARIKETAEVPDGDYGVAAVDRVRVLTPEGYELYEKREVSAGDGKTETRWILLPDESGTWRGYGRGIPLATAYACRGEFMHGEPALEDLAWMNVAHWQSASDQRNILRFARTGLLFVSGITEDEIRAQGGIVLGPSARLYATSPNADAKVVEHSGSAIKAGADDLRALEQQMQVLGLQPFFRTSGNVTATEKSVDAALNDTEVKAWIKAVEDLIYDGYALAARWIGAELPDDFGVDVYSDFTVGGEMSAELDVLMKMRLAGDIDRETLVHEAMRRGLFGSDVTEEEIIERVQREGPSLADVGVEPEAGEGE